MATTSSPLASKRDLDPFRERRFATVSVEGLTFRIRNLSELEQATLDAEMLGPDGKPTREGLARARCRLVAAAWVDGEGRRVCTDADDEFLGSIDTRIMQQLSDAIQAHCGAAGAEEAFEDAVKNSAATREPVLPIGSHSRLGPRT